MKRPFASRRPIGPFANMPGAVDEEIRDDFVGQSQINFKFSKAITGPDVNKQELERIVSNAVTPFYEIVDPMYAPDEEEMFVALVIDTDTVVLGTMIEVRERIISSLTVSDMQLELERVGHTCPADVRDEILEVLRDAQQ